MNEMPRPPEPDEPAQTRQDQTGQEQTGQDEPRHDQARPGALVATAGPSGGALTKAKLPSIRLPVPPVATERASVVELVRLFHAVEQGLVNRPNPAIQLVSAHAREGAEMVAFNLAWAGAVLLARRVLFIDAHAAGSDQIRRIREALPRRLDDVAAGAPWDQAMARVSESSLHVCALRPADPAGDAPLVSAELRALIGDLRSLFDLTVIAAAPAEASPLCAALSGLVDASVLVVEADRTRSATAERLRDLLACTGSPVIGAVLNHRRPALPRFLRRRMP